MKKIAIVNRTNLINFGSVLQVFALQEAIRKLGYQCEVVWESGTVSKNLDLRPKKIFSICLKLLRYPQFILYTYKSWKSVSNLAIGEETKRLFKKFVRENIKTKNFDTKEFKTLGNSQEFHKFICGSDQIWCSTTLYPDPLMYLRFAPSEKRVAYAPSIGRSYIPSYNKKVMKKYISDIPIVSIREEEGAVLLKDLIGKAFPVTLDPTLLFDEAFWCKYIVSENKKDYILCYFLTEPSEEVQKNIVKYADGKEIIALRSHLSYIDTMYNKIKSPEAGPAEFLGYVNDANFIFTDSYHGMLFSIIFEKEFLSVEREYGKYDQSTRQKSILSQLQINEHYNKTGIVENHKIDYKKVNLILTGLRHDSWSYIENALKD